ncbi:hypothetical protein BY996DRAFT_6592662 [Phakopsora pachyrhizi]|nr:hypothetical protein BY996DRAFT_6592662 [Phakopsora pachyrhizi]
MSNEPSKESKDESVDVDYPESWDGSNHSIDGISSLLNTPEQVTQNESLVASTSTSRYPVDSDSRARGGDGGEAERQSEDDRQNPDRVIPHKLRWSKSKVYIVSFQHNLKSHLNQK